MKLGRTILIYGTFVFAAIVLTQALRMAGLICVHSYSPMGARPATLLKGSIRFATLIIAPIQTPILLLGTLSLTRRHPDKRLRYVLLTTVVLCFMDLFIRPIGTWTDWNGFHIIIGIVPLAMLASSVALFRNGRDAEVFGAE